LGRLALGGFSFYYKRKNAAMDDYLKSSTPTFILEPKHLAMLYFLQSQSTCAIIKITMGTNRRTLKS